MNDLEKHLELKWRTIGEAIPPALKCNAMKHQVQLRTTWGSHYRLVANTLRLLRRSYAVRLQQAEEAWPNQESGCITTMLFIDNSGNVASRVKIDEIKYRVAGQFQSNREEWRIISGSRPDRRVSTRSGTLIEALRSASAA